MTSYVMSFDIISGKTRSDMIIRLPDNAHIPADPLNVDWQAYQAWLAAGNKPEEPDQATKPGDA